MGKAWSNEQENIAAHEQTQLWKLVFRWQKRSIIGSTALGRPYW
jgi:hypothetical protein